MRVNKNLIKEYDFKSPEDLYYMLLWTEELFPDFSIAGSKLLLSPNETQKFLSEHCREWGKMRRKYQNSGKSAGAFIGASHGGGGAVGTDCGGAGAAYQQRNLWRGRIPHGASSEAYEHGS